MGGSGVPERTQGGPDGPRRPPSPSPAPAFRGREWSEFRWLGPRWRLQSGSERAGGTVRARVGASRPGAEPPRVVRSERRRSVARRSESSRPQASRGRTPPAGLADARGEAANSVSDGPLHQNIARERPVRITNRGSDTSQPPAPPPERFFLQTSGTVSNLFQYTCLDRNDSRRSRLATSGDISKIHGLCATTLLTTLLTSDSLIMF